MKTNYALIDKIQSERLISFLLSLNWKEISTLMQGKIRQFISPDEEFAALVPLDKSISDYYRVMSDTIESVALSMGTSIAAITNRLLNTSYDVIKWRVGGANTSSGTLPFLEMAETIETIKNILATSYVDITKPAQYHKKIFTDDVKDNLSKYSFGQSEVGSYILNIMCPLNDYQYQLFDEIPSETPINRRINMHLISSINDIQNEIHNGNINKLDEDVCAGKYSINFLDSLTDIYDSSINSKVKIAIAWSNSIKLDYSSIPSEITLRPRIRERIFEITDKYRPKQKNNEFKIFYGKIETISSDSELEMRKIIAIKVVTLDENNKKSIIQANLKYDKYQPSVSRAFENGLTVKVSGVISRKGNIKIIEEARLEVLE